MKFVLLFLLSQLLVLELIKMNKRGQGLVESETIEYILFIAIGLTLSMLLVTSLNTERYNQVRVDDLALSINSVFIPKGNVNLDYDMGIEVREVRFKGNEVATYIKDPIRERSGVILIDKNYIFNARDVRTDFLDFSKVGNNVEIS